MHKHVEEMKKYLPPLVVSRFTGYETSAADKYWQE